MNGVSTGAPSGRMRRIGTVVARSTLSATLPRTRRLTPLRPWLDAHQPDAVITSRHCFGQWPADLQAVVPDKLGVAVVSVLDGRSTLSGIDEGSAEIGRTSVQVVTGMVERGETGIPAVPQCLLVQSKWHEGTSIRMR